MERPAPSQELGYSCHSRRSGSRHSRSKRCSCRYAQNSALASTTSRTRYAIGRRAPTSSSLFEARTVPRIASLEAVEPRVVTDSPPVLKLANNDAQADANLVGDPSELERGT